MPVSVTGDAQPKNSLRMPALFCAHVCACPLVCCMPARVISWAHIGAKLLLERQGDDVQSVQSHGGVLMS